MGTRNPQLSKEVETLKTLKTNVQDFRSGMGHVKDEVAEVKSMLKMLMDKMDKLESGSMMYNGSANPCGNTPLPVSGFLPSPIASPVFPNVTTGIVHVYNPPPAHGSSNFTSTMSPPFTSIPGSSQFPIPAATFPSAMLGSDYQQQLATHNVGTQGMDTSSSSTSNEDDSRSSYKVGLHMFTHHENESTLDLPVGHTQQHEGIGSKEVDTRYKGLHVYKEESKENFQHIKIHTHKGATPEKSSVDPEFVDDLKDGTPYSFKFLTSENHLKMDMELLQGDVQILGSNIEMDPYNESMDNSKGLNMEKVANECKWDNMDLSVDQNDYLLKPTNDQVLQDHAVSVKDMDLLVQSLRQWVLTPKESANAQVIFSKAKGFLNHCYDTQGDNDDESLYEKGHYQFFPSEYVTSLSEEMKMAVRQENVFSNLFINRTIYRAQTTEISQNIHYDHMEAFNGSNVHHKKTDAFKHQFQLLADNIICSNHYGRDDHMEFGMPTYTLILLLPAEQMHVPCNHRPALSNAEDCFIFFNDKLTIEDIEEHPSQMGFKGKELYGKRHSKSHKDSYHFDVQNSARVILKRYSGKVKSMTKWVAIKIHIMQAPSNFLGKATANQKSIQESACEISNCSETSVKSLNKKSLQGVASLASRGEEDQAISELCGDQTFNEIPYSRVTIEDADDTTLESRTILLIIHAHQQLWPSDKLFSSSMEENIISCKYQGLGEEYLEKQLLEKGLKPNEITWGDDSSLKMKLLKEICKQYLTFGGLKQFSGKINIGQRIVPIIVYILHERGAQMNLLRPSSNKGRNLPEFVTFRTQACKEKQMAPVYSRFFPWHASFSSWMGSICYKETIANGSIRCPNASPFC